MTETVRIYTDGACKGNPGPGGWGALLCFGAREKELFGGEAETTNNRMELAAVINALAGARARGGAPRRALALGQRARRA
jgi:ribonuclease HI